VEESETKNTTSTKGECKLHCKKVKFLRRIRVRTIAQCGLIFA